MQQKIFFALTLFYVYVDGHDVCINQMNSETPIPNGPPPLSVTDKGTRSIRPSSLILVVNYFHGVIVFVNLVQPQEIHMFQLYTVYVVHFI